MDRQKFKDFHIAVFQLNEKFSKFHGNDMAVFVHMCKELSDLIRKEIDYDKNSPDTDEVFCFAKALYLWPDIVAFLKTTVVYDNNDVNFNYTDNAEFTHEESDEERKTTYVVNDNPKDEFRSNPLKLYEWGMKGFSYMVEEFI